MAGLAPDLARTARACLCRCPRSISKVCSFTTTTARRKHGPIPTFPPTSSPALDELLSTFRSTVFLPAHLLKPQRDLIYRSSKHHHILGEDPVVIDLPTSNSSTEAFTLAPVDPIRAPATRTTLDKMLDLMQTKSDWNVLPAFLEGVQTSGRKLKQAMIRKIIERAAKAGSMGSVLECLRRVERTGIKLDNVDLARVAMVGAVQTAILGGWSEEATMKAAKQAEALLVLMEDPAHVSIKEDAKGTDPRKSPEVLAIAMGLVALNSLKNGQLENQRTKVERYARRVLTLWPKTSAELEVAEGNWREANEKILIWAPVAHGLRWAIQALGEKSETAERVREVLTADVEPLVEKAKRTLQEHAPEGYSGRGKIMYEELERLKE